MSWNYRICTKIEGKEGSSRWRSFNMLEVYYNEDKIPHGTSTCDHNLLCKAENYQDLENTYQLMRNAFLKPVIDLDNFPNEFKIEN